MKKLTLSLLTLCALVSFYSCNNKAVPDEAATISNLKAAIDGEASASAKYAQFAKKADEEGLARIAAMFRATSAAEAIHRDNHLAELKTLGQDYTPVVEEFEVKETLANLAVAKAGEEYEFQEMYKGFIEVAQTENMNGAKKSFSWASDAEVMHADYYQEAITALQNFGNEASLSAAWIVCPICGDTYKAEQLIQACRLCGCSAERFLKF